MHGGFIGKEFVIEFGNGGAEVTAVIQSDIVLQGVVNFFKDQVFAEAIIFISRVIKIKDTCHTVFAEVEIANGHKRFSIFYFKHPTIERVWQQGIMQVFAAGLAGVEIDMLVIFFEQLVNGWSNAGKFYFNSKSGTFFPDGPGRFAFIDLMDMGTQPKHRQCFALLVYTGLVGGKNHVLHSVITGSQ